MAVLLLLNSCRLLLPLWEDCSRFCYVLLSVHSSFTIILMIEEKADCFTLSVLIVSCDRYGSVALSRVAVGWSSVCDCDITS